MISYAAATEELKSIRESGVRDSKRVLEIWTDFIKKYPSKIGYELAAVVEQVLMAALDCAASNIALDCIMILKKLFPSSARVCRLYAMCLEHSGKYANAQRIYDSLIKIDPTNTLARKRLIAIHKAKLNNYEAIDDYDAWNELSDLYLKVGDYKHAAFCLEEVLLSNPDNYMFHLKYADVKYTEGGIDNIEIARAYYCKSCLLNPNSFRSLYGLILACTTLIGPYASKPMLAALTQAVCNQTSGASNCKENGSSNPGTYNQNSSSNVNSLPKDKRDYEKLACWAVKRIKMIYSNEESCLKNHRVCGSTPVRMPESLLKSLASLKNINDDVKLVKDHGKDVNDNLKAYNHFNDERLDHYFMKVLQQLKENAIIPNSTSSSTNSEKLQSHKSKSQIHSKHDVQKDHGNSSSEYEEKDSEFETDSESNCDERRSAN